MKKQTTAFELDGEGCEVTCGPDEPLLYVLRNELGRKGARFGCGEGLCGACMVLVDERPTLSCDTPLWAVAGRRVRTIESHVSDWRLNEIVTALTQAQAGQCGYCLPGIAMRARALLADSAVASRESIAEALDGNLCRCGTHSRILRAIETAAERIGRAAQ